MNVLKNIELKTINESVKKPKRSTSDSAGHDIFSQDKIVIPSKKEVTFKLPFYFKKIGETINFRVRIFARSSFGIKKKVRIIVNNKVAKWLEINPYNVDNYITLFNDSDKELVINKNEHFAQFVITSHEDKEKVKIKFYTISNEAKEKELEKFKRLSKNRLITDNNEVTKYISDDDLILLVGEQKTLPTGLKSEIPQGTFMGVHISKEFEDKIFLANGTGIIDADYFSNQTNDGHLLFAIVNNTNRYLSLKGNEPIIDLYAEKYYILEEELDNPVIAKRVSGVGSTSENN